MNKKENKKINRVVFTVRDLDCATCALVIERQLKKVEGVKNVGTALMLNKVFIDYDESKTDVSKIMQAIEKIGYSNYLVRKGKSM